MSSQKKEQRSSAVSTVVATVIVAAAAVAAIIVLIMMSKKPDAQQKLPDGTTVTFKPTQEFADECGEKAQELLAGNYKVVRLFVSEGLSHLGEPYGNPPEDELYTVDSEEYETFEQVESLVKSIYTAEEANRILTQMPSDPAAHRKNTAAGESGASANSDEEISRPELIAVYAPRDVYVDIIEESSDVSIPKVPDVVIPQPSESGTESHRPSEPTYVKKSVLGISEYFKPYTDYKKPWGSISLKVIPANEEECYITVYLGAGRDVDLSSVEDTDILNTKMVKENGEWRLTDLVY